MIQISVLCPGEKNAAVGHLNTFIYCHKSIDC